MREGGTDNATEEQRERERERKERDMTFCLFYCSTIVTMETASIPQRLSAAVLQFCQENIHYNSHLSVQGSLTIFIDDQAIVATVNEKVAPLVVKVKSEGQLNNNIRSFQY